MPELHVMLTVFERLKINWVFIHCEEFEATLFKLEPTLFHGT